MRRLSLATSAAVAAVLFAVVSTASEDTHTYADSEAVLVWANKIGPFNNPLETYAFFEVPGCPPASYEHRYPTLGQALAGDEIYETKIAIRFGHSTPDGAPAKLCDFKLSAADADKWRMMVAEQYWYQLTVDGMPAWASFGHEDKQKKEPQVYTHQHFQLGFNGDRIVLVNLTVSNPKPVVADETYAFTYDVTFADRKDIQFADRFRRYLDTSFSEHRIRWFSIFNAFMTVLFLSGMVLTILSRTLRSDYARYAQRDQEIDALGANAEWSDESGWKQLHGDVFRVPPYAALLCALIGTGWQLVSFILAIVIFAIVTVVYTGPTGVLTTYAVFAFTITSFVAGYVSGARFSTYAALNPAIQNQWIKCMALTAGAFPLGVLVTGFLLNFVAIAYDSAQAIPIGGMVVMLLIWGLGVVPLTFGGTIVGRLRRPAKADLPRVHQVPRLIPQQPWYFQTTALAIAGGTMPFGSIFIELYFVFTSFWGYTTYYVYGFVLLVFVMLVFVTACVTVVACYFMLNAEEHRWQWASFAVGGSVSGYVFVYAAYFYWFKTHMTGFFMLAFYFTYMALLSAGLAVLGGAVGFSAASLFVTRIFRNVKCD